MKYVDLKTVLYPNGIVPIEEGGTGATNARDAWDKLRQKPVKLWSGTWDTGSINVPHTNEYNVFLLQRGEVVVLAYRRAPHPSTSADVHEGDINGIGSMVYDNSKKPDISETYKTTTYVQTFFCRTKGDTWSEKRFQGVRISPTYNVSETQSITSIWGLM